MKTKILTLLISLSLLACCERENKPANVRSTLSRAEAMMTQAPDSALMLLEDLSKGALRGRENRAHFALLYSQALDKNYIDLANDSIIRVAVDYYAPRKDNNRKMLAYYYLGRVQYNAKDYQKAIISFTIAEKIAQKTHESFYLGQIYNNMMMIWNKTYNNDEELSCAKLSYKSYFQDDSVSIYTHYALLSVGVALHNSRNFQEAEHYCDQAEAIARQIKDTVFLSTCLIEKCNLLLIQPSRCFEAKEYIIELKKILHDNLPADLIAGYAYILSMENEIDSVSAYMEQALSISMDSIKLSKVKHYQYLINKAMSNEQEALRLFEEIVETQNIKVEDLLDESIARYQRDYFQTESELNELKLQSKSLRTTIFIIILFCIIVITISLFLKQKKAINSYIQSIHSAQEDILHINTKNNILVERLFKEKYVLFNRLSEVYYTRKNSPFEQQSLYKEAKNAVEEIYKNNEKKLELETIINDCYDNYIQKLRTQIPNIKNDDIQIICYLLAGFSYRVISLFMNLRVNIVYNRVYRVKEKISKSNIPDKDFFYSRLP